MKNLFFRMISLILALCLTVGLAVPAFASETDPGSGETQDATETMQPETDPSQETSEPTEPETSEPEGSEPETEESTEPSDPEPEESAEPSAPETEPEETTEPTTPETEPEESTEPTTPETEPEETEPEVLLPYTTEDGHYIAQPELLKQFTFPDNWSKEALEFCVGNGILQGKDTGLAPKDYTTRAETAAILVRLLGAEDCGVSLSGFRDVSADAWYYDEMSAAVGIGLVNGTSNTTLEPNSRITRQQVCTMLSRAFGIYAEDEKSCDSFTDGAKISSYARGAIGGLKEAGYLEGYLDGSVKPQAYITRAELAKLLYGLVTCICDSAEDLPEEGNVLYRGSEAIGDGYCLDGSLTIGCGYSGTQTLNHLDISERLVIQAVPGAKITLNQCQMGSVSVSGKITVSSNTKPDLLFVSGKGSSVEFSAYEAHVYASCTLVGNYQTIECQSDDITLTLNGSVGHCNLNADRITLEGKAWANYVDIYGLDCSVKFGADSITDHPYNEAYNSALTTVQTVDNWYNFQKSAPYSKATMEGFVDKKGYSSETNYLIWISTKTLTVNIFQGSKGNWDLIRTCPCALGKASTPTVKGVFKIYLKTAEWDFGSYKCHYISNFYAGYAFHSRLWSPSYSYLIDDSIDCLVSHGCVRMLDEDCYYIYANMPINTTVVVY